MKFTIDTNLITEYAKANPYGVVVAVGFSLMQIIVLASTFVVTELYRFP